MGAVVGRRVLLLLVAAMMAALMSMGTAVAAGGGGGGGGGGKQNNKVYVCHNWDTLYVSKKKARFWVNNYRMDYYGPCFVS